LASFERLLLFVLPFDGGAMLLTFTVEVAEDEFGLLEEPADVVPDQRFDDVGADTWVVAGRAALVGAPRPLPVHA
jgi:hypothetical protein